jgi:hypothetical protein
MSVFNTDLPNLAYNVCIQWRWYGQAGIRFSLLSPSSSSPPVFSLLPPRLTAGWRILEFPVMCALQC